MFKVNDSLKKYIEDNILCVYEKNDSGHGIRHIKYVTERSLEFSKQFDNINLDMVYTIASYHDIGHHIDKDKHEFVSADIFYKDEWMMKYFNDNERTVIKEAIEDHRASLGHEPRNVYGKIVSSADRECDVNNIILKTHNYSLKHFPEMSYDDMVERAYVVLEKRINDFSRYPSYVVDKSYDEFIKTMKDCLVNKEKFRKLYDKVINNC